jgi:hypothetical protein
MIDRASLDAALAEALANALIKELRAELAANPRALAAPEPDDPVAEAPRRRDRSPAPRSPSRRSPKGPPLEPRGTDGAP